MINNFFKKFDPEKINAAGKNQKGSTLIELMVAVFIFSAVMTSMIQILIRSIDASKRMVAKQENIDNARYAMEFMTKELRMASEIDPSCKGDVSFPVKACSSVTFTNSIGDNTVYALNANKITRNGQAISSDNIRVTSLVFWINDWDMTQGSGKAPLITIFMEMTGVKGVALEELVNLQSSVSPRIY